MAKKSHNKNQNIQQLSLFDEETMMNSQPFDDNYDDEDYNDDYDELPDPTPDIDDDSSQKEWIPFKLFKDSIIKENKNDPVMRDFAEYVLPPFLKATIGVTAKGGKFIEKQLAEGKNVNALEDQSLNTHILNGLFAANFIEQELEKLNTTIKRCIKELERRIGIAGFILHDFEKFNYDRFPEMPEKYKNIEYIRKSSNQEDEENLIQKHKEILDIIIRQLRLDYFINPSDPEAYKEYIDDFLTIAYNTQTRWDTNWNFSEYNGLSPKLLEHRKKLVSLTSLACLADRLSSIIKHPQDALSTSLDNILGRLSDRQLKLTYHNIAENRGVLTNILNNALIDEYIGMNLDDCQYYKPILYLPTGVIYLTYKNAPPISLDNIPNKVIQKMKSLCAEKLRIRYTGFNRDGKGIKYADYYNLFFNTSELMEVGLNATFNILNDNKKPVSKARSETLQKFQQQKILSKNYNFEFGDNPNIDRIAEFCDLISRKIWVVKLNEIEKNCKQNKDLPKPPKLNLIDEVIQFWDLSDYLPAIREIERINETLKEHKIKGNTGGLPLEWYYLAAKYLEHNQGIEDVKPLCKKLLIHLIQKINPILENYDLPDGWDDLREWVKRVIMLPNQETNNISPDKFLEELKRYQLAKKSGRGKQLICSISHSAYTVTEQMESSVLFTPQVYTNKQMLGGSNAKRNIDSIAGIEMMLRQILMSQTASSGKNFEETKYRYLYLYPTYYCTPETNTFLHQAYETIRQSRFDTGIRNHFVDKEQTANLTLENYQNLDIFHLEDTTRKNKIFKLSYPEDQPLTFYFMALPPEIKGKDNKTTDTESWIMPAWLGLAFPMILDIKVVVSESPIPPFKEGSDFPETVFLDSAPQAFKALLKQDKFRLDYILENYQNPENKQNNSAPLNALTAAYTIHLDVNSKQGKGGYDPNWGKLAELAKDLETSPLYVFSYLKKIARGKNIESPSIRKIKLYAYDFYPCFDPYIQFNPNKEKFIMLNENNLPLTDSKESKSPLNHPLNLTLLYREFYRAKSGYPMKANAILKPIDEAASIILNADNSICSGEALIHLVAARISKLMDRVHSSTAEGRWRFSGKERDKEREKIMEFSTYFVRDVFQNAFGGDRARLAGRQLNIIRDTCEFLYRLEDDKNYQKRKANGETKTSKSSNNSESEEE